MLPNAFVKISIGDIPHSNISGKVLRGKLPYWSTLELLVDPKISFDENDIADKEKKEHLPLTGTEHYVAGELLHILQIDVPMTKIFSTMVSTLSPGHCLFQDSAMKKHGVF